MSYKQFHNILLIVFAFILSTLLLTACSNDEYSNEGDDTSTYIEILQSELLRDFSPDIEENELKELVIGNSHFALDLYQAICNQEGNIFYSPYSISLALAMTYAGARNETEQQIQETLHFMLSQERLHPNINALDLELANRGEGADGLYGEEFRLNIANSIWGQKGYSFLMSFLDNLAVNYGAGLNLLDFKGAPEDSRIIINNWVSDQTESRIKDLIPKGLISSLTRLVLVNAIYFNAAWSNPFQEEYTQDDTFYLLDGGQVTVPMMSKNEYFGYTKGINYEAIELMYDGEELSMIIILPQSEQFKEFEMSMSLSQLSMIIDNLEMEELQLKVPKFNYESKTIKLKETLSQMGMPIAFSDFADFSGIDGTNNLSISEILHKAFISVDESGTEAAASTSVVIWESAISSSAIDLIINRPFIFLIRDINTNTLLFLGRIVNPAE